MPTALVTGASYGVGRAAAIYLARRGYRVICVARSGDHLGATVERIHRESNDAEFVAADLGDPGELTTVVQYAREKCSDLQVLAHFASPRSDPDVEGSLQNTPAAQIAAYLQVTLGATILLTKELEALLADNPPAHIFFMASDWALRGSHGPAVFSAAKAGVAHFARSIRRQMASRGIRTTVFLPGDIASFDTEWAEPVWDLDDPVEKVRAELGESRILLSDITAMIGMVLDLQNGRVEEIIVSPTDPDYDY